MRLNRPVLVFIIISSVLALSALSLPLLDVSLEIEYFQMGYYLHFKATYSLFSGGQIVLSESGNSTVIPLVMTVNYASLLYSIFALEILLIVFSGLLMYIDYSNDRFQKNEKLAEIVSIMEKYHEFLILAINIASVLLFMIFMLNYDKITFYADETVLTVADIKEMMIDHYTASKYFKTLQPTAYWSFPVGLWLFMSILYMQIMATVFYLLRNRFSLTPKWAILSSISAVILVSLFLPWVEFFELDTGALAIANAMVYVIQNHSFKNVVFPDITLVGGLLVVIVAINLISAIYIGILQVRSNRLFIEIMRSEATRERLEDKYREIEKILKVQRILKISYLASLVAVMVLSVNIVYKFMSVYRALDSRLFAQYYIPPASTWLAAWVPWLFSFAILVVWSFIRD